MPPKVPVMILAVSLKVPPLSKTIPDEPKTSKKRGDTTDSALCGSPAGPDKAALPRLWDGVHLGVLG